MKICDAGCQALAAAIINQAVKDWYQCQEAIDSGWSRVKVHEDVNMFGSPATRQKIIEGFFVSEWFQVLSDLDGAAMVEQMRARPQLYRFLRGNLMLYHSRVPDRRGEKRRNRSWDLLAPWPELKELLIRSGLSQRELAREMGISHTMLRRWIMAGLEEWQQRLIRETLQRITGVR